MQDYYDLIHRYQTHLHQEPELAFQEEDTASFLMKELGSLATYRLYQPTPTSVVAVFKGAQPGPANGLRADIDALVVEEDPDHALRSKRPGLMHACGHDGHTAILLGVCHWLSDHLDKLKGEVHCIFQHAEEVAAGGALQLIEAGVIEGLDFIYGNHLDPSLPTGMVDIKPGPNTTNSLIYEITIQGRGGHSSMPHETVDPTIVAASLLMNLQTIVSRQLAPQEVGVISNTVLEAGDRRAKNVIPDTAYLAGSIRTFEDEVTDRIVESMEAIVADTCRQFGATGDLVVHFDCPSLINDPALTDRVREIAEDLLGADQLVSRPPAMVGEDFAYYSREIPACFSWVGCRNEELGYTYPLHHPKFRIDPPALENGFDLMLAVVKVFNQ